MAHYEPYSLSPQRSVPSYRLGRQRVGSERRQALDDCESHAIGAWLPELEFTHYWPTAAWRQVLATCAAQVTVGGNALAAMPYVLTRQPFLAWVATGWDADRKDRVARFPWPCKLLDRLVNGPVLRRQERRILRSGTILALSDYTRRALDHIAGAPVTANVLPMPVDTLFFTPRPAALVPGRIGFSGRLDDPRKNLDLLLAALAQANQTGARLTALLIGSQSTPALAARIQTLGLSEAVTFTGYLPRAELRDHLQTLDFHSPYGCSKGTADQYTLDYSRIYGLKTTSFRQSCIYGTRQFGIEDQGWVAWFTIAAVLGKPITLYGDGKQIRDVLQVDDLARAYAAAYHHRDQASGQAFNIGGGPGNTLSLLELLSYLASELGIQIPLRWSDWRPGDQPVFVCNLDKANRLLDWRPRIAVRDGVHQLIHWVRDNRALFDWLP